MGVSINVHVAYICFFFLSFLVVSLIVFKILLSHATGGKIIVTSTSTVALLIMTTMYILD